MLHDRATRPSACLPSVILDNCIAEPTCIRDLFLAFFVAALSLACSALAAARASCSSRAEAAMAAASAICAGVLTSAC